MQNKLVLVHQFMCISPIVLLKSSTYATSKIIRVNIEISLNAPMSCITFAVNHYNGALTTQLDALMG